DVEIKGGMSFTLRSGDDAFVVVESDQYHYHAAPYQFLRYSTAAKPGPPPGYQVKNVRRVKAKYDRAEMTAFLEAARACAAHPLPTPEELALVAESLSSSPAEIGLIWMGAVHLENYSHNFLPAELRAALGLKTTDASAGRQALRNLKPPVLAHLCEAIVS